MDNILLAHEIMDTLKKKKGKKFSFGALKIEMSKAYDKVNWNFLKVVLTTMRFDPKWIGRIMECVSFVSYTLLVNGSLTSTFHPTQGLRQGSLISVSLSFVC